LRVNLSDDLTDYEERRVLDHRKLETMIAYCQTARCYTRFILEYFGETDVGPDWRCHNCGSCDALESWELQHGVAGAVTRLVG
jgi:ATP-dependent DNA helicase RecQ